jgi:hypothetical protein
MIKQTHRELLEEAVATFKEISMPGRGLEFNFSEKERADYWAERCIRFQGKARTTLARIQDALKEG